MTRPVLLVCAPADSPTVVPGSIFGRRCSACDREVMIAPSGQSRLRADPGIAILCASCFLASAKCDPFEISPAAPIDIIGREARSAEPNPRAGKGGSYGDN